MKYRAEIDGLRALAVVPVILFHAGFELFSGGFVGVDVFFVISGYLITTIIINEMDEGNFSLINFYERRARRILPALFFIILTCVPFAWMWLLPGDMKDFSQSLVAVATFSSNIFFWIESDYFDTAAEMKPFLHTWSLAVEEQYYIIFPLLLMLMYSLRRSLMLQILAIMFVMSLVGAHWGAYNVPSAAFYLLPTRGWELLIGAFVAFYLQKRPDVSNMTIVPQLASFIGLLLIVYAVFIFDKYTPFPSLYALIPTVGAALIILFAGNGTLANTILRNKLFVGIGVISYSAYLWHQPLFAFARHKSMNEPNVFVISSLCVITLLLGYLSWRYIEKPFRNRRRIGRSVIFVSSVVFGVIVIAIGVLGHTKEGFKDYYFANRVSTENAHYISYLDYKSTEDFKTGYRYGICFYGSEANTFDTFKKENCLSLSTTKPNVLLIGDSHAAHLAHAISVSSPINLLQATASGCRPLYPYSGEKWCTDLLRYIYEKFIPANSLDAIIISGHWKEEDIERINETISLLSKRVPKIIFLGPTVEYKKNLPLIISKLDARRIEKTHRLIEPLAFKLDTAFSKVFNETFGSVKYVSLVNLICERDYCDTVTPANIPMAWDKAHFTLEGSEFIINKSDILLYLFES